jgi:predicted RNA-binding protein with EMAP domain
MVHIALNAVTKLERNFVTTLVMDQVSIHGGWIEDVHLFSNIMTNIRFVMKQDRIASFVAALSSVGLEVSGISEHPIANESNVDCNGSLQITFVHNEPDLKRDVPRVPG